MIYEEEEILPKLQNKSDVINNIKKENNYCLYCGCTFCPITIIERRRKRGRPKKGKFKRCVISRGQEKGRKLRKMEETPSKTAKHL